jgi:peptidoglycan/LPS O-acetylase OafA/YrhL
MTLSNRQHYHQLDALRGVAALMVVVNHFVLLGPLAWVPKTPLRIFALGHEAVILFFVLSGFVLTLQLRSSRGISYRDYLIKRICRIYLPYLAVLVATFSIVDAMIVQPVGWAGNWFNAVWSGPFTGTEIVDHLLFIGQFKANQMNPVIWSLVYEMRISLVMPLVVLWTVWVPAVTCIGVALCASAFAFALVMMEGAGASSANFSSDWAMTLHYLAIFVVGSLLAAHRARWRQWLMKPGRVRIVLGVSLVLYFVSRSVMSINSGAAGQFFFDWCIALGSAGLIACALVSTEFARLLKLRPIAFLGEISYSLYLTHAVVLLTVVHLMPSADMRWYAIVLAAALVIPVAALTHYVIERRTIVLGQFLSTRRAEGASSGANQPS